MASNFSAGFKAVFIPYGNIISRLLKCPMWNKKDVYLILDISKERGDEMKSINYLMALVFMLFFW